MSINLKFVPWHIMLRYIFLAIPPFIVKCVLLLKQYEVPYRYALWSVLGIVISYAIVKYRRLSVVLKLLTLYLILALITEVLANKFAFDYSNNSPIYHFFIPIQLIIFALIYYQLLNIKRFKFLYVIAVSSGFLFMILYSLSLKTIWSLFPSINFILLSALVLPFSLLYFRKMILNPESIQLENQPFYWFNIGTFVFFTLDFFILGFHTSLKLDVPNWMYDILWGSNLFLYATYFIAIFLDSKSKPMKS